MLIDRLWPRGLKKSAAKVDLWLKEAAPSTELPKWFSHDPEKWPEFKKRYFKELKQNHDLLVPVLERARKGRVTIVFGSKEERFNNAVALREYVPSAARCTTGASSKINAAV